METITFKNFKLYNIEVWKVDFLFIENNLIIEDFYINWKKQDILDNVYNWDFLNKEQLEQLIIDIIKELASLEFDYLNFDSFITLYNDIVDDKTEEGEKWGEFMKNIDEYLENLNIRDYILKQSELCKTLKVLVEDDLIFFNHIEPLYKEKILNTYYLR